MKTLRVALLPIATLALLVLCVRLIPEAYVSRAGITVLGTVIDKHESIEMPKEGEDTWRHVFEVTYRYQPVDSMVAESSAHRVDASLYSRLRVGSPIQVRYSPSRFLRPMEGVGSILVDSSWRSRIGGGWENAYGLGELVALVATLLLGCAAYDLKSKALGVVAACGLAALLSGIFVGGFLLYPALFWICRKHLVAISMVLVSLVLGVALLYSRIPWPTPMPTGPQGNATAIVRHVWDVHRIWGVWNPKGESTRGLTIRQPFQMADLEFTPVGAAEPVHVLDRVDSGSVPGLSEGATVQVTYSLSEPRAGRIAGGSRTYAEQAFRYCLALSLISGIVGTLALVGYRVTHIIGARFRARLRASPLLGTITDPNQAVQQIISRLPADDPRRKALEERIRARHEEFGSNRK